MRLWQNLSLWYGGASTGDRNSLNSTRALPTVKMKVNIYRRNESGLTDGALVKVKLQPSLHDDFVWELWGFCEQSLKTNKESAWNEWEVKYKSYVGVHFLFSIRACQYADKYIIYIVYKQRSTIELTVAAVNVIIVLWRIHPPLQILSLVDK